MRVYHPNAVRETVDDVDDRVTLEGTSVAVDEEGALDAPSERAAENLAERYGLTLADIRADETETCEVVKADDEVCGRDLPCPYHSDGGD